jgi:hypothetical protein
MSMKCTDIQPYLICIYLMMLYMVKTMRASQKFPRILWHRQFGVLWVHSIWTECYWSFLCEGFAEDAMQFGWTSTTSSRNSGFCIKIMHGATHCLLCNNSLQRSIFLSSPNHCTLQISFHMCKGACFITTDINWMLWLDSGIFQKKILLVLPTMARSTERERERERETVWVCVWAHAWGSYFECD